MAEDFERASIAAVRAVHRLDMAASWAMDGKTAEKIDGTFWTGAEIVSAVVRAVKVALVNHHGRGNWNSSHAMGTATAGEVKNMLIAWGASEFTVRTYAKQIARGVRSNAATGTAD